MGPFYIPETPRVVCLMSFRNLTIKHVAHDISGGAKINRVFHERLLYELSRIEANEKVGDDKVSGHFTSRANRHSFVSFC